IGVPIGSGLDQPVVIFHHVARRSLSAEGWEIDKTTASPFRVQARSPNSEPPEIVGSGSGGLHPEASAKAEDQRLNMLSFHSSHTARRRPSPVMHTRDPPSPEPAGLRVTGDDQGPSGGPRP